MNHTMNYSIRWTRNLQIRIVESRLMVLKICACAIGPIHLLSIQHFSTDLLINISIDKFNIISFAITSPHDEMCKWICNETQNLDLDELIDGLPIINNLSANYKQTMFPSVNRVCLSKCAWLSTRIYSQAHSASAVNDSACDAKVE